LEAVHIEIQTVIMEKDKHGILSVSKPAAKYVRCMLVKACLARRYIPIAWGQVKMTFIPAPGKGKGHHPLSLLYFMQKTMQNWWPGISGTSHWAMSPTSTQICLQARQAHSFFNIERAFGSTSGDISRAAKPHGLRDILQMDRLYAEWQKNYIHGKRRNAGGVCAQGSFTEQQFITPDVLPGCRLVIEGLDGIGCYTLGYALSSSAEKFLITIPQVLLQVLCMEQKWCDRNQSSIYPQKFQHQDQHFTKPGHIDEIC